MILDRRKFLIGMLSAAVAAPAIVRASSLMKVRFIDIEPEAMEIVEPDGWGTGRIRELLLPGLRNIYGKYEHIPQWETLFNT